MHRLVGFATADGIGFPMADETALKDVGRTLRNMGFFMFPGVSSVFELAMGSPQEQNKMGGLPIHPLIDGLMANGSPRVFEGQSSGDKFWRPSRANSFFDIVSNSVTFESLSPMGFAVTFIRSFLSFMIEIIAGINWRGISFKLP